MPYPDQLRGDEKPLANKEDASSIASFFLIFIIVIVIGIICITLKLV